jgi:hypothetical protein
MPTNSDSYSATCNGAATPLTVNIPPGATVTSVDVQYQFTAQAGAWTSEQMSRVRCASTNVSEASFFACSSPGSGVDLGFCGNSGGTLRYTRNGLTIANGVSPTGAVVFELQAYRTWPSGTGCNTTYQFIPVNTFTVTVNFTGGAACTGTPAPGNTTTTASSVCSGQNFTLGLQFPTTGSGVTYQWQVSTTGSSGPWTNLGTGTPTYLTSQSETSWYQAIVTCDGNSATSNPVVVNMGNSCQCAAYPLFHASSQADEEITNVTVGTLINNSTCATVAPGPGSLQNRYSNYTGSVAAPAWDQGQIVAFSVTQTSCGGSFGNGFQIYVDWNLDGDFLDANEQVYTQPVSATGNHTKTGTFTVPVTATPGTTRMRVVNVETTFPSTTNWAHTGYTWGETEDYCVTVNVPPPCVGTPIPGNTTSSTSSACSGASFTLGTQFNTIGDGITYQWQSSPDGSSWTDIPSATEATYIASQTAATWYQVIVTCTQPGGGSATSTPLEVTMQPFYNCYCTANLHSSWYPCISNVTFGSTLNNSSSVCNAPSYTSYANGGASTTGEYMQGLSYTLSTLTNDIAKVSVWIDLDRDGLFETTEWFQPQATGSTGTMSVLIPLSAQPGITGMRVRSNYTWSINEAGDACTNIFYGETEDYLITILEAPPCAGTPNPGNTIASAANVCAGTTINFSVQNPTLGFGVTYQWQVSTTGATGPWTNVGTDSPNYSATQNQTSWYQAVVTCNEAGGGSGTSNPVQVTQNSFMDCYCTSSASSTADEEILNVTVGSLNNTSICGELAPGPGSVGSMYSNYKTLPATSMIPGEVLPLSLSVGQCSGGSWTNRISVFIDWNQNGLFTDPGEQVFINDATAGAYTVTGSVTVPVTATIGTTVMRVVVIETTADINPCGTYTWGETEDYLVLVCQPPVASATVTDDCVAGEFSVNVDAGASTYTVYYSVNGGAQQSAPYIGTPITLGPFATTASVSVEVSAGAGCSTPIGSYSSNCPITIDCDATSALIMNHCYANNDPRTFTFVSSDPAGSISFKFLQPSPIALGDGVTFYDGPIGSTQISLPPAGNDLSSLGFIQSTGNTLSFTISADAAGSCVDGDVNDDWTFQIRCAGCFEPSADPFVTTDCGTNTFNVQLNVWDFGTDENGVAMDTATIQWTVDGGLPQTVIADDPLVNYDLGDFPYNSVVNISVLHEVDGACNLLLGNFMHNAPCPPANDSCTTALPLTVNGPTGCPAGSISGTTQYGDMTGTAPSCASANTIADVWYSFNTGTSLSPMTITLTLGTAQNIGYQVFTACGSPYAGSGNCTASVNGTATVAGLAQNTTYYLRVFTRTDVGSWGTFNVCLSANNAATLCDAAINIPSVPVTNQSMVCSSQNLLSATTVTTVCGGGSTLYYGGNEALYTFTPSVTGSYVISYAGQSWTSINVFSDACPSAGGTCVGSVANSNTSKSLIVPMTAGTLYYIWFDTWPSPQSPCPGAFSIFMETCPTPSGVTVTNITDTSADVNWTGDPGNYIIEYGPAFAWTPGTGALPGAGGTVVATSTWPYTLTGLTSSTNYQVYVRKNCGLDGFSLNTPAVFFTTAATPPAPPTCNSLWYDSGGPGGTYANNENWTFTLCPTLPGDVVTVSFNSFNTESNWDRLHIYDGPTTASPMFSSGNGVGFGTSPYGAGGWWGTTIPGPFTSTTANGGCMTFAFWSDNSVLFSGWEANITCAPPPSCPPPTSPSTTLVTHNSATVTWNGAPGTYIIEYGPSASFTTPGLANLPGVGGTVVTTSTWPYTITGLTPTTQYRFFVRRDCTAELNGYSPNSAGVLFTTQVAPPACGGNFYDSGGPFGNYQNLENSTVTICPDVPGDVVTVNFTAFNIESGWDYMYVYNGNSTSAAQIPGSPFTGTASPGQVTSTDPSGCLTFLFTSDGIVTAPGWEATVACGEPPPPPTPPVNDLCADAIPVTCGSSVAGTTVNSTTTGQPAACGGYGAFQTAGGVWYTFTGTGDDVTMSLCGGSSWDTQLAVFTGTCGAFTCVAGNDDFCGLQSEVSFSSVVGTTYYIYVTAFSSSTGTFTLNTTCVPVTPPPACGGNFYDSGGPTGTYQDNEDNIVTICPDVPGDVVTVEFTSFSLETDFDYLAVHNGNTISDPQIGGPYTGTASPGIVVSSHASGCLTFHFTSDGSVMDAGWSADITCAPPSIAPVNDDCNDAQLLTVHGTGQCPANATSGTTIGATQSGASPSCDSGPHMDVWYAFNSGVNSQIDLSFVQGTISYSIVEFFTGTCAGGLVEVACFADPNDLSNSVTVTPNTDYLVRVSNHTDFDTPGTFNICLSAGNPAPANDHCNNASFLAVNEAGECPANAVTGTNIGATQDGGTPGCDGSGSWPDVWYSFNSGAHTSVDVDFTNISMGDIVISVYEVSCAGLEVFCDIGGNDFTLEVTPNTTYLVRISNNTSWGVGGDFSICVSATPFVTLNSMVFLDGAYNATTGLMRDDLRTAGYIPGSQPYGGAPWSYTGTEAIGVGVLDVTGDDAIVDWVLLELRDAVSNTTVVARRAALVQRDGDIVDMDGVGEVKFTGVTDANFYLVVRHRNHNGVMTNDTYPLAQIPTSVDLTVNTTATYGTNARKSATGTFPAMTMWTGNANSNTLVNYSGSANDRTAILNFLGAATFLTPQSGYNTQDVNMNGVVTYSGSNNDRTTLLNSLGASTFLTPLVEQLP